MSNLWLAVAMSWDSPMCEILWLLPHSVKITIISSLWTSSRMTCRVCVGSSLMNRPLKTGGGIAPGVCSVTCSAYCITAAKGRIADNICVVRLLVHVCLFGWPSFVLFSCFSVFSFHIFVALYATASLPSSITKGQLIMGRFLIPLSALMVFHPFHRLMVVPVRINSRLRISRRMLCKEIQDALKICSSSSFMAMRPSVQVNMFLGVLFIQMFLYIILFIIFPWRPSRQLHESME